MAQKPEKKTSPDPFCFSKCCVDASLGTHGGSPSVEGQISVVCVSSKRVNFFDGDHNFTSQQVSRRTFKRNTNSKKKPGTEISKKSFFAL